MNWRERITEAYRRRESQSVPASPEFQPGAPEDALQEAERALGQRLPEDLRALLSESDGVLEVLEIEGERIESLWILWTTEEIVQNQNDTFLFFGSVGTDGILFGYDRTENTGQIWAWHPMESRRQLVGESLAEFLYGWIGGSVAV